MSKITEDNIVNLTELKTLGKADIIDLGEKAAAALMEDGYNDAAPIIIAARKAIEYLNSLSRALESKAIDEMSAEDTNEITAYGSVISMGATGDRLSYKADPVWLNLSTKLKAREALLKIAKKDPGSLKDSEGVDVPTVPLSGASKTVIRVKL